MLGTVLLLLAAMGTLQKASTPPDPGPGPQTQAVLIGPPTCRFAPPADLPAGKPVWIGPCADGKADGFGVVRVADTKGAKMFYGLVKAGIPVEGMMGDSTGNLSQIVTGFDASLHFDKSLPAELQQDPKYWKEAAGAARWAAGYYQSLGNKASSSFYLRQAKVFDRGPGE